jgi:hypothetical protein
MDPNGYAIVGASPAVRVLLARLFKTDFDRDLHFMPEPGLDRRRVYLPRGTSWYPMVRTSGQLQSDRHLGWQCLC